MSEEKRPLKVFLSHAHSDAKAVHTIYHRLTADGVDAWLDKEKLLPGQDWELEIRKAVRAADMVVVCLSKGFNQRGYRQKEVRIALDEADVIPKGEIFIIPARLEECEVPESLKRWQWVDLFEEDGYEMLMRALRARADKVGTVLQTTKTLPALTESIDSGDNVLINPEKRDLRIQEEKSRVSLKELVTKKVAYFEHLAQVGPLATNDVDKAIDVFHEAKRLALVTDDDLLSFFITTKAVYLFFLRRWHVWVEDKHSLDYESLKSDFRRLTMAETLEKGLKYSYALTYNEPEINFDFEREAALFNHLNGLVSWLVDELIVSALFAYQDAKIQPDYIEMFSLKKRMGDERYHMLLDRVGWQELWKEPLKNI